MTNRQRISYQFERGHHCDMCGEWIPFAIPRNEDGTHLYLCHECSGEKHQLMPGYNKDAAWLHDAQYHGSRFDAEW
ncbi:MAG: hypothetical protein KatS3mg038_3252 [Candidatus Kapaibacterium sp.]|nr:MAG: hypothetical protein KatS3mg038_1431 [Candidatus Kapabacteria bacterium]GIV51918.1 MAG: hypothetical protein KatS3mg038_2439 [Candidatus Kapabacteria bacterium]GIV52720.1 MAG: hypothetical protein KatS3mg038_3241 [Candidatus Kapabacteria bacterium]GIV52731.1 MAG: hypothetical protein KatS3mg038_3252 [Candidatus Kapabacteria bacterium]GIW05149.1 MAG: hypothetical protein KatS3mg059_1769 [Thermomicrobiales bacterium]